MLRFLECKVLPWTTKKPSRIRMAIQRLIVRELDMALSWKNNKRDAGWEE